MKQMVSDRLILARSISMLFAAVALALASVGIYGVMSYSVFFRYY